MAQMTLLNTGVTRCGVCGKKLTNPISVSFGLGPVCRANRGRGITRGGIARGEGRADFVIGDPLEDGLVLWRDKRGSCWTNAPHAVIHHSPTGFEWGYGGSGPADLALNVVEAILRQSGFTGKMVKCYDGACFALAFELHQEFKEAFIVGAPPAGGRLDYGIMAEWVNQRMDANVCERNTQRNNRFIF